MRGAYARVCVVKVLSASMAKRTEVTFTFHWLCTKCSRFFAIYFHIMHIQERVEWNVGKYIGFRTKSKCVI